MARSRLASALSRRGHRAGPASGYPSRPALAPALRVAAPPAIPRVAAPEGGSTGRDGPRGGGRGRSRVGGAPGSGHRPPGLVGGLARESSRGPRAQPVGLRHGSGPPRPGEPHPPLPRPGGTGLHEGRCLPDQRDRPGRRPRGGLRVLAGGDGALERGARRGRRIRARDLPQQACEPVDLGPRLPLRPAPMRRGLEHAVSRGPRGRRHDGPRPGLRPHRDADGVSGQALAARPVRAPDHHAAVRDRARADPSLRALGGRHGRARGLVRGPADALDLRAAGRADRPAPRVRADRVPRPDRRRAGDQPVARGGGADAPREPLDDLPDGDVAAPPARGRQRVPAGLRGEHGRLRQSPGAVRQLRAPVHPDLLRRGGGGARSGPRGGAGHRAPRVHAGGVLRAAAMARPGRLHHRHRERGLRLAGPAPRAPPLGLLRARPAVGDPGARDLRRHPRRRVRAGHRAGLHADPRVPP